jgi:hypothetical protein
MRIVDMTKEAEYTSRYFWDGLANGPSREEVDVKGRFAGK